MAGLCFGRETDYVLWFSGKQVLLGAVLCPLRCPSTGISPRKVSKWPMVQKSAMLSILLFVHFVPKCACMITNHGSLRLFWKCAYQGIKIISVFQPPKRLDSRYKVVSKLEVFPYAVLEVQVTVSHFKPHFRIPVACCHLEHWDCAIWEHVQLYICVVDTVARPWQHCVGNQWHFRMHYD